MSALDLDPLFLKALKLLHSKSKDAAEQLKAMHDEVVAKKKFEIASKRVIIMVLYELPVSDNKRIYGLAGQKYQLACPLSLTL